MSEPVAKERPIVDLDDFERRLRQRDHHNEDPLAELARLVGETSDPYGDVFAREPAPEADFPSHDFNPRHYGHHDIGGDLGANIGGARSPGQPGDTSSSRALAVRDYDQDHAASAPRLGGDFAAIEAGLRGALADHGFHESHGHDGQTYSSQGYGSDHDMRDHETHDGRGAHDPYAGHYGAHDQGQHTDAYAPLPPPDQRQWADDTGHRETGSRRPLYFLVATIAVGVLGIGIAFALKGVGSRPGEVRTIQAASGPTKVQPPADASADAASHDPGVLGKAGSQPTPTRLVNGEEQPVDVSATMQANATQSGASGDATRVPVPPAPGQTGAQSQAEGSGFGITGMPAPKKVRVVSVRPDGSIVPQDAPTPANDPIAALSAVQPPALSDSGDAKSAEPKSSETKSGATPKTTSRVSTTPKVATTSSTDDAVAAPKPTKKPKVKRVAAVEPTDDTAAAPADTARGNGDFSVQLAAPASESEARAAASRFAKKFASVLDGHRLGVHKAQSNGKAVYRVRAGSMSKDDAVSLCDKLKADGGSCFVARN